MNVSTHINDTFPVDAVITWVDGDDPAHMARRRSYITGLHEESFDDIGGETRYRQCGELEYCIGSIFRFAPFIRKIFIVTDRQTPLLQSFIEKNFASISIPVEVVDHTVIFRGFERFLPVFNSLSIETMLWNIPGLSEHFVYLNDDFMLMSPAAREDFFVDASTPVCYGKSYPSALARFLRTIKPRHHGHKPFGFKDSMLNAADLVEAKSFAKIEHTPLPLLKSRLQKIFTEHPEFIEINLRHRFRDPEQYNPQALFYICTPCEMRSAKGHLLFIKFKAKDKFYIERKIREGNRMGDNLKFCCINSMEKLDDKQRIQLKEWLDKRMEITR